MASSSRGDRVRPFASLEAEVSQSKDELDDELRLQEILLYSLENTAEDTPARRGELKAAIKSIKRQLRRLANQGGKTSVLLLPHEPATEVNFVGCLFTPPPSSNVFDQFHYSCAAAQIHCELALSIMGSGWFLMAASE